MFTFATGGWNLLGRTRDRDPSPGVLGTDRSRRVSIMQSIEDHETFTKARDLAKAAMNRAQANADAGQLKGAQDWTFIADGWARIADLYRERP